MIALQEVNQKISGNEFKGCEYYCEIDNIVPLNDTNFGLQAVNMLKGKGLNYYWTWLYVKNSYGKYNEGLAILSKSPILKAEKILLTKSDDNENYKKRMALGVLINNIWFYNVHLGWLFDKEEAYSYQWGRLRDRIKSQKKAFVMGDFNIDPVEHKIGYDLILSSDLEDSYTKALIKDDGITVNKKIDGWENNQKKLRLDYIFSKGIERIEFCKTIFNGKDSPQVSDHFGVIVKGE